MWQPTGWINRTAKNCSNLSKPWLMKEFFAFAYFMNGMLNGCSLVRNELLHFGLIVKQEQLHGEAVRVEANLSGYPPARIYFTANVQQNMEYNIRNCSIWCQSTSMKVISKHFSLALSVFEIFWFQNSWPWKCRSRSWRTKLAVAVFDGKCLASYLMAIVMFIFSAFIWQNSHMKSLTVKI